MKAKKSPIEVLELIKHKLEDINFLLREIIRLSWEISDRVTGQEIYIGQLDELIGDLHQIELGK